MTATRILVSLSPGEQRACAWRDGTLLDYAIHRPGSPDGVGDRLRGRVLAHVPAMAGAFVALPDAEGFLPDSGGGAGLGTGDAVVVEVIRAAAGGKGPRLRALASGEDGRGPPALLSRGPDAVARLQALHPGAPVEAGGWDDAISAAIEALGNPELPLPGGARASIHPTPALVAIDVDTGSTTADRRPKPAAQAAANRAAIPALAAALRLRNLSGIILVDAAGMSPRARAALAPDWRTVLGADPLAPRFLGFTAGGLAEIVRSRRHPPLHELLAGPHAAGLAALRALVTEAAANPANALALRTSPAVARALAEDAAARTDVLHRTGRPLTLRSDPALPLGGWQLEMLPRA